MMKQMVPQDIAAIGTFLTLTSLLGTFFYVHLTTWLRDMLALKAKYEFNTGGNTGAEEQAMRECRYALKGLFNILPGLVCFAISIFIIFSAWNTYGILAPFHDVDPLANRLFWSLTVFLVIYFSLVIYLLGRGYMVGMTIRKGLSG